VLLICFHPETVNCTTSASRQLVSGLKSSSFVLLICFHPETVNCTTSASGFTIVIDWQLPLSSTPQRLVVTPLPLGKGMRMALNTSLQYVALSHPRRSSLLPLAPRMLSAMMRLTSLDALFRRINYPRLFALVANNPATPLSNASIRGLHCC
jgi:hypothetical protein